MRRVYFGVTAVLLATAFSGCLLPSFEKVDEEPAQGGGAGVGGSSAPSAGDANQAGDAGSSGALPPAPVDDVFSVLQGGKLKIAAPGVLENDEGSSLTVSVSDDTDTRRPSKYDASSLVIDADGALTFEPQADFFGVYSVQYTVLDKDGQTATANVTIHVQPVSAKLATVRDGVGGFVIDGAADDAIGGAIAGAGDVNNDGFDDVLIGAAATGESGAGRAYVVYGRAKAAPVALKALAQKSTERAFVSFDGADGDGAGNSVAGIGDLNGDGFSDFAIAASKASPAGAVYVLYGGALSGGLALGGAGAARGIILTGDATPIGASISRAGDVNGDGTPDLLVSGASTKGRVYAVLGSDALQSSVIDAQPNLLQIEGDSGPEALPQGMDFVGHVNGDKKDEVVVASLVAVTMLLGTDGPYPTSDGSMISTNGMQGGWRYGLKVPQTPAVAGAGNVDGDAAGTDDLLICETRDSTLQCRVVFSPPVVLDDGWQFTGFSDLPRVTHGADINGDGFSDLLFGDGEHSYLVFGKRSGHNPVDVSALDDGSSGFAFQSEAAAETVSAVATVGDVNGDGLADYAVGVPKANGGTGSVYVVFGEKY